MTRYLNSSIWDFDKVAEISALNDVEKLKGVPSKFVDPKGGKTLVCVVDNGVFQAAVVCDSPKEFAYWSQEIRKEGDVRPQTWLLVPNSVIKDYS